MVSNDTRCFISTDGTKFDRIIVEDDTLSCLVTFFNLLIDERPENMKLSIDLRDAIKGIDGKKILTFFQMLFDFSFSEFITVKMFPVLYFVILASSLFTILYFCFETFLVSVPRGVFYLFVAAPVVFITVATIVRGVMEFYIVVFRMAESVEEMRIVSSKFTGISDTMDGVNRFTKKLPFWNVMSPKGGTKEADSLTEKESAETKNRKKNRE